MAPHRYLVGIVLPLLLLLCGGAMITAGDESQEQAIENYENYFNEIMVDDDNADAEHRNAVLLSMQRWPERTLYYAISPEYTDEETENVHEALRLLSERTCLQFEPYERESAGAKTYIHYTKSEDKCGTRVGYNPLLASAPHEVLLNPRCLAVRGVIQHETLHVLGLYHEQSRPDRGDFVRIQFDNIAPQYWSQFMTYPWTTTLQVPYDYRSLMHYSQFAFAKDKQKPTMLARDGDKWVQRDMGQTDGPSIGDITKINTMYNCPLTDEQE